jgi:deaminated glutathione amidase
MSTFTAACIQNNAQNNIADNLPIVRDLIHEAISRKVDFIALPECVSLMEPDNAALQAKVPEEKDHPFLQMYEEEARNSGAWILGGTLAVKVVDANGENKIANRLYLFNPAGQIAATYDKIHMFDVDLGSVSYKESATYAPGDQAVVTPLPWGNLGLSICYDIRFAYLYRALAQAGASILCAPAAFTKITGEAHWHILQRARAIETGSFVISPGLCGTHAEGKQTFGHSVIIDPWGEVLADGGPDVGVITAEIDMTKVAEVRGKVPALTHDRTFKINAPEGAAAKVA